MRMRIWSLLASSLLLVLLASCGTDGHHFSLEGRFLKNPLPVPKRRPHVRMEFDLMDDWDIPVGQEHFDIDISDDDDFDI